MSNVKWSQAQKDHRRRMGEPFKYASAAVADPDLRPIYIRMAEANHMNKDRPFDMAVKDYSQTGNERSLRADSYSSFSEPSTAVTPEPRRNI